jgi:hypothetical protein
VLFLFILAAVAVGGLAGWSYYHRPDPPVIAAAPELAPAELSRQVHEFCGACHAYPPAESFPRSAWKEEVERGYFFFGKACLRLTPPPVRYAIDRRAGPPGAAPPAVSHPNHVHLSDPKRTDLLACEMRHGLVMALTPSDAKSQWRVLGKVSNPAHAEVVDLNKDGIPDVLVADLGSFPPADRLCGRVVWLRGNKDGSFTPFTLLKDVGRVADVRAADFDGDGKLDLIVAVFGWQDTGEIMLLKNRTADWDRPDFDPWVADKRHGAIHVPVADLNGDGRPDFIALIAQEHEEVCAFINEGDFRFRRQTLYAAPHPAYGSSGIQLVDLDKDGHLDVLYTNGDVLDSPHLLKPYHGVQWLRNRGTTDRLDFEHRPIAAMYGVHRALAADVDGDGDLDVVAVSYLPGEHFPQRDARDVDAIVLFEQTSPGKFARHTLASKTCDHVTCVLGDVFGTGRVDLVTASFTMDDRADSLLILRNLGRDGGKK